jgi:hypothetical protein
VSSVPPPPPSRRSTRLKSVEIGRPPTRGLSLADQLALMSMPDPSPIVCLFHSIQKKSLLQSPEFFFSA